jgi:class 3 adenylate cyclase/tetratricopeptide (TPR) repeat protein
MAESSAKTPPRVRIFRAALAITGTGEKHKRRLRACLAVADGFLQMAGERRSHGPAEVRTDALDIRVWLGGLGLESYEEAFRSHAVDADVLFDLTEADLERLGVLLGHRKKMLGSIAKLKAQAAPPQAPDARPTATNQVGEGERRQVTVVFADLVGYTALSRELDAEDTHALLGRFFDGVDRIIIEHGGHIDKHIGDCVMAVFGAPIAHGNDEERAVLAALAIHAAMPSFGKDFARDLRAHIGIANGEVVASGTGSLAHREYTVTGDTVNLAARLVEFAGPGETLISDPVRDALGTRLDCADAGSLSVKGFALPVKAHRLRGLRAPAEQAAPLVGRLHELHQFKAALSACLATSRGSTIHIRGEAGIGKTRLVRQFAADAVAAGFVCHYGQVLDFGSRRDAIRDLIRGMLGIGEDADNRAAQAIVAEAVAGLASPDDAVFLYDLLDLSQPLALRGLYDAMDNSTRNRGKARLLLELIASASRKRPRLLVIEDAHWADGAVRESLATLATAVSECPAVFAVTSRIEGDPIDDAWRRGWRGAALLTIELGPLRREDALVLARSTTGATGDLAEQSVERAGGNPLFLEQLLRHAAEDVKGTVPGSIQALVQARVDGLEPPHKRALQAASVLGQQFSIASLRHLIGDQNYDCAVLRSQALLRPVGEDLLFAHALIRDAVYSSLLRARRAELHLSAAAWYEGRDDALRAEHLDRAGDAHAPRAYADAVRPQMTLLRYERALQLAERGLAIAASTQDRLRLSLLRAEILRELGRLQDALQAFRDAAHTATDDLTRSEASIGIASCVRLLGASEEGFDALEVAEPLARKANAERQLAEIHYYFGSLLFTKGDVEACLHHHEQARDSAVKAADAEWEARALSGLGDAHYGRGRMRLALEHFRRCRALCQERGFGRVEVGSTHMIGVVRRYLLECREAIEDVSAATAMAAKVGNARTRMVALNILGEMLVDAGQIAQGRAALEEAIGLALSFDNRRYRAYILHELGRAYVQEARSAEAIAALDEALALSRETGMRFIGPRVLAAIALIDDRRRADVLAQGDEVLRAGCLAHNALWFHRDALEACLEAGEPASARARAAAFEDLTAAEPLPWSDFFIARGRALADHREGRSDQAHIEELKRLKRQAGEVGLIAPIPRIDAALAQLGALQEGV